MEELIASFLSTGHGHGYGSGHGSGDGYGHGHGHGYGSGAGYGSGDGYGHGHGYGAGYGSGAGYGHGSGSGHGHGSGYGAGSGAGAGAGSGLKSINCETIYMVDGVPTILRRIRNNVAKGAVVQPDLTLQSCYVVKQGSLFAHGETLHEAMETLRDKLFEDMPEEDRIAAFVAEHEWGTEYPDTDFFDWHHRLTGSCEMGRRHFAAARGLDKLDGKRTVESFIELTRDAYGGSVIRKLESAYAERR